VAIVNQEAFVGAFAETVDGLRAAGRVYAYNATTGSLIATLTSPNAQTEGFFGVSIDLSGDNIIIGASSETDNGLDGRAYIFNLESLTVLGSLVSPNPAFQGQFGLSVDLANGRVYVGAPSETVSGQFGAGNIYIFDGTTGQCQSGSDAFQNPGA